jgi:hypothetical protein
MLSEDENPIYCVKDVCRMLRISQATLFRMRKQAGLSNGPNKRKTRYTLKEIDQLADIIRKLNCDRHENN